MKKKPKSINALMAYMRDEKGLSISGSSDKKKLRYMVISMDIKDIVFIIIQRIHMHSIPLMRCRQSMTLIWRLRQCFIRR